MVKNKIKFEEKFFHRDKKNTHPNVYSVCWWAAALFPGGGGSTLGRPSQVDLWVPIWFSSATLALLFN